MFGISGCEEVKRSIFWAQRSEKRERQMKGVSEQKVSDWQMNAWTLQTWYCRPKRSVRYGGWPVPY